MRIASDIGGTFTDLVFIDEDTGTTGSVKSSTTPDRFETGVMQTLDKAGCKAADVIYFVHGSTVVINALTERKGEKTGLITTRGFRDVLEITRANRPDMYNLYYSKPKPFIERRFRLEVRERVDARGNILVPLSEEDVEQAVRFFAKEGITAVAVCFLHSYAFPDHEKRCGEIINAYVPDIEVTLSCEITKEWREYERTNTAVLNSYVKKKTARYLSCLETSLREKGINSNFYVMQSNGGTATFAHGKNAPINMVESGPVGGVIGAASLGRVLGEKNIISFDVGGTTAKTSLMAGGQPTIVSSYHIERTPSFAGYPILAPTVDIIEIGAGGGTIAWIDPAGTLRIGPQSTGADPGPACYGKGGREATITDANVLAGRINPNYFLGGDISLDINKVKEAFKPLSEHFEISNEEAAMGVIRLADAQMVNALKLISIRRGFDPRDFTMAAFGGGGALHAGALARELHIKEVIIPRNPGVFSAWGMLTSDLRQDFIKTNIINLSSAGPSDIEAVFLELEEESLEIMKDQNIGPESVVFTRFADIRYHGQEHTIKTPVTDKKLTKTSLHNIADTFHILHEQQYSFRIDASVEMVNYHLICTSSVNKPKIEKITEKQNSLSLAEKEVRNVNFDELGYRQSRVFERDRVPVNREIEGPMIIEEPSSTTVVFPDQKIRRDEYGILHITPL